MEDEPKVRSSAGEFQEFIESTVWEDMRNELELWLEGARDGMEDVDASEKELYRNQGRADAVRRMMALPEVMHDSLLEEQRSRVEGEDSNISEVEELTHE